MTTLARSGNRVYASAFGLLMVGLAGFGCHGPALAVAAAAVLAVGAGVVLRSAATVAVLLSVAVLAISDPSAALAALSGLCAAAYLVCRHASAMAADALLGSPVSMIAAVGFTFAGLVATAFPLQVPWLPLAAPLAVLAIYVVATRPYFN